MTRTLDCRTVSSLWVLEDHRRVFVPDGLQAIAIYLESIQDDKKGTTVPGAMVGQFMLGATTLAKIAHQALGIIVLIGVFMPSPPPLRDLVNPTPELYDRIGLRRLALAFQILLGVAAVMLLCMDECRWLLS